MTAIVTRETGQVELDSTYEAPPAPPGWARVRVTRAGICATDLELVQGYKGFHGVLGHEFCGVVEESPGAAEWVGRRVVGEINIACGACASCRRGDPTHCARRRVLGILDHDGAFAERLLLPLSNLHIVPDDMPDDTAVFTEPVAAALEIAEQSHVRPSDTVYVLGDGKLGLLVAQALALTGCACLLIGRRQAKLDLARGWGLDTRLLARDSTPPDLAPADIVVDCTGRPDGLRLATSLLRPRATLVLKST
jgi:threonine dehydrogenase-like Zn-dependent dehydrogenase